MDDGELEPKGISTPMTKLLVGFGLLFILGVVVLVGVYIAGAVRTAAPALKEDWKYIGEVRSRDAATVKAQTEAGAAYKENLALDMTAAPAVGRASGVTLSGTITNRGERTVLKVWGLVKFPKKSGGSDDLKVVLFDASPLSVRTDSPLVPGVAAEFVVTVDEAPADWDSPRVEYELGDMRVEVDIPEATEPEAAAD